MATQAIEKLQKRLEKDPTPSVFLQLAEEYRKEGLYREALHVCQDGLHRHPNHWSVRVTMARIHHQIGDTNEAREELEKVIKAVPDNLVANRLLGDIYFDLGRNEDALKRYKIVEMLTPADQEVRATIQKLEARMSSPVEVEFPTTKIEPPVAVLVEAPAEPAPALEQEESAAENMDFAPYPEEPVIESAQTGPEQQEPAPQIPAISDLDFSELSRIEPQDAVIAEASALFLEDSPSTSAVPKEAPLVQESSESEDVVFMELDAIEPPSSKSPVPALSPLDHTQPMREKEEPVDEADELTTETLAELYVQQGLMDKAIRVYQKLLLNDPNNLQIIQRLKELSPFDVLVSSAIGESPDREEPAQIGAPKADWADLSLSRSSQNLRSITEERRRKITTLENWLASIRRERS